MSNLKATGNLKAAPLRGQAGSNNIEAIYPLSPMQEGMLFHTLYAPTSGVYFEQLAFTLHGDLNVPAFMRAWQQVIDRHSVLRTLFVWERLDKPLQVVRKQVKLPWEQHDWRELSPVEQQQRLEAFLQSDRERGFELSKAPLMRLALIQVDKKVRQFIWSHHHLLLDGWSTSLLLKEIFAFYEAFCRGQNLHLERSRPYRDYIAWLQQQDLSRVEVFWRQMLQGFTAPTPLEVDRARIGGLETHLAEEYGKQQLRSSPATTSALQSLARQHRLTLNTLVQGAWAILLSRYSGEEDVVFGATVSGRPADLSGVESMVGLFINTLPVRVQVSPEVSLLTWLKGLQAQQAEARQYEYSPLAQVQGWSEIPKGQALFESILVFQNYPAGDSAWKQSGSVAVRNVRFFEKTNYPLTVIIAPGPELQLHVSYDGDSFAPSTISRMLGHLQTLLDSIAADPDLRLSDLPLLTEAERHQLLVEWNNTRTDYPRDQCIHQLFEAQVERTPDAVAVVFGEQQLTYRELNCRANQLAHYLQTLGVGPEVLVGVCVERSLEMVIGVLGILKAGGTCVPLDPSYPQERLAFMLEDTQTPVLLTEELLMAGLPRHKAQVVCLDSCWETIVRESDENPLSGVTVENLVYVLYTSGSTGRPKGVALPHRALSNMVAWQLFHTALPEGARMLQFSSLSFDASFTDMFMTWCSGSALVIATDSVRQNIASLPQFITDHAIERLNLPFIVLQHLAGGINAQTQPPLCVKEIISTAEQLQVTQPIRRLFAQLPDCSLHNQYGPSESHVVTAFTLTGSPDDWPALPPIGRPIASTQIYLLDRRLQPVPIGVPGELYIGGACLARGYLNRPDMTAEKFIPNPFNDEPGARLYKTGDLARYLPDGNIEFLGRIDYQVKVRGFRVELGEIETVVGQHPAVREAVVVVREDVPGNKMLVAYIVPREELQMLSADSGSAHDTQPSALLRDLRRFLQAKLPDYMIPSAFVLFETLPLTPTGKTDRRALPAPDTTRPAPDQTFVAPRNYLELKLVQVWEDILNMRPIGVTDNFFDLGGHSLLVVRIMAQIQKLFGRSLPLSAIFRSATVEHLASILRQQSDLLPQSPLVAIQPAGSKRPFFCIHPGSGTVLYYADLARHLGPDQPFYGLQASGLDGEQEPYTRVKDMAAHYIEALSVIQPQGPYLLGGWSMGGVVAFEMARQLQQQGHKVALLVLIDSSALLPTAKPANSDQAALLSRFIMDLGNQFRKDLAVSVDELRSLEPDKQLSYTLERAKLFNVIPVDVELAQFQNIFKVYVANFRASRSYRPQLYSGRMTLFQAGQAAREITSGNSHNHKVKGGEFTSWQRFASGPIEIYTIPGNHYTMLTEPNVQVLARQLGKCLAQADSHD